MRLYYASIAEFPDIIGIDRLPVTRQAALSRLKQPEDQRRSLVAGLLLRKVFGVAADTIQISSHGKPFIPQGVEFNLSHSGEYVILGVSSHPLGVDIQRPVSSLSSVRRVFTLEEQQWLSIQPNVETAFLRLWTAKESVMKMTGEGFSLSPCTFSVLPIQNGWHTIMEKRIFLSWNTIGEYIVCIAGLEEEPVQYRLLHREELL